VRLVSLPLTSLTRIFNHSLRLPRASLLLVLVLEDPPQLGLPSEDCSQAGPRSLEALAPRQARSAVALPSSSFFIEKQTIQVPAEA
jgi:hypothetical protein